MTRCVLFVSGLAALMVGCRTFGPQYQILVSNTGEQPIHDVSVEFNNAPQYQKSVIAANSSAEYKVLKAPVPNVSTLHWSSSGKTYTKTIRANEPLPEEFHGKIYYQIDDQNEVTTFIVPDKTSQVSYIPWAKPENWEGTISIPGLPQQE